jgi:cytoskeletal protein CcmA (bactofilin family)
MSEGKRISDLSARMACKFALCTAFFGALAALSACGDSMGGDSANKVNGTVHIAAGKEAASAHTVNGSIHVDDNATVTSAGTVNGNVTLGAHATATSLSTVNGSVTLADGAHATAGVESVNGDLTLNEGADVAGGISNVNGKIKVTAAHVAGGIHTVSGNISIMGASHVEGGILVKKPSGNLFTSEDPTIVIGPGATVQGELRFERKVRLFVSDKATIGTVTGATPVAFTGDTPPP